MLAFEKLAAGMFTVDKTHIALVPFIKDCAKMFHVSAQAKNITIEFVVEGLGGASPVGGFGSPGGGGGSRQLVVSIDRVKMKTVFRNLFSNAIKFTPQWGKITVTLAFQDPPVGVAVAAGALAPSTAPAMSASAQAASFTSSAAATSLYAPSALALAEVGHGGQVVVSVRDSGSGMTADNLQQLFGEGVQFNANSLQGGGGSGFGLFIAKGIVMLHGGQIWAESEGEGCGSTFLVKLPGREGMRGRVCGGCGVCGVQ